MSIQQLLQNNYQYTVVAGEDVGAGRSGVVVAIHQKTLVGQLALHRHDLVRAVVALSVQKSKE